MRRIGDSFLAHNATVIGDVSMGPNCNIWFGTVVRGDIARITLGESVNIQDLCMVHTDFEVPLDIEDRVVAGHSAILHGRRIGAGTLVGMGAKLLSGSVIGKECIVAAGAVVTENKEIPPRSLVMGLPGKVVREVTDEEAAYVANLNRRYLELAGRYAAGEMRYVGG